MLTEEAFGGMKFEGNLCIDKPSSAELQEAINSSFQWYQEKVGNISCEEVNYRGWWRTSGLPTNSSEPPSNDA